MKKLIMAGAATALVGVLSLGALHAANANDPSKDASSISQEVNVPFEVYQQAQEKLKQRDAAGVEDLLDDYGLADEQIKAIQQQAFNLETYTKLVNLERDELIKQGVDVTDVTVDESNGYPRPGYGWRDPGTGRTQDEAMEVQMKAQSKYTYVYQTMYAESLGK